MGFPDTRRATLEIGHKAYGMDFYKEIVTIDLETGPLHVIPGSPREYAVYLVNYKGIRHLVGKIYADNRVIEEAERLIQARIERMIFSGKGIDDFITRVPIPKQLTKYSVTPPHPF